MKSYHDKRMNAFYLQQIEQVRRFENLFTPFEDEFLDSIESRMEIGGLPLSAKQAQVLHNIWNKYYPAR